MLNDRYCKKSLLELLYNVTAKMLYKLHIDAYVGICIDAYVDICGRWNALEYTHLFVYLFHEFLIT